jgi:hypothetical protein
VKTIGSNKIEIYIYDNGEAAGLSEITLRKEFKGVEKSKVDSLSRHFRMLITAIQKVSIMSRKSLH